MGTILTETLSARICDGICVFIIFIYSWQHMMHIACSVEAKKPFFSNSYEFKLLRQLTEGDETSLRPSFVHICVYANNGCPFMIMFLLEMMVCFE